MDSASAERVSDHHRNASVLDAYIEPHRYFILRIVEAIKLPNWLTCILYAALVYVVLRLVLVGVGADISEPLYARGLILMPFLAAYMAMLCPVVADSTTRLAEELAPVLRTDDRTGENNASGLYSLSNTSLFFWTLGFQVIPALLQLAFTDQTSAGDWVIFWARQLLFLHYTFYIFLYAQLRGISQFINREVEASLHHMDELRPIGRIGLKLASVVAFALAVVLIVQAALSTDPGVVAVTAVMSAPAYILVLLAVWMPANPVRQKIQAAKDAELSRIRQTMKRGESLELFGETVGGVQLLDYRNRVDDISAWPMDLKSGGRLVAYLLLPVISWIAAAVVSLLVEQAFW